MKNLYFAIAVTAMLSFTATAGAQEESRTLAVGGGYQGIAVGGSHHVIFTVGPAGEPVAVSGHPTDLDNLEVYVEKNKLHIKFRKDYNSTTGSRVEVRVQNPELRSAAVGGSAALDITGGMDADKTDLSVGGSGTITVDRIEGKKAEFSVGGSGKIICLGIDVKSAEAAIGGSGRVELGGSAGKLEATIGGSGAVDAQELSVQNAVITVAGSGVVRTHCTRKIDATIGGSGKVYYSGDPATVSHHGKGRNFIKL